MNPQDGFEEDWEPAEDFGTDVIAMNPPRWQRWRPSRPVAIAGVAVVALAGGAGVGYAATHSLDTGGTADTAAVAAAAPSATPSPAASGPSGSAPRAHWGSGDFPGGLGFPGRFGVGGIGDVLHGQLTVPKSGGGYQTVDVQDGTVTAVSASSVTVKSADGFTASYAVTSSTLVDAKAAGIGSVQKGDTVLVTATVSGSTATAASIIDVTAVKAGRASFRFTAPSAVPHSAPAQPPGA